MMPPANSGAQEISTETDREPEGEAGLDTADPRCLRTREKLPLRMRPQPRCR